MKPDTPLHAIRKYCIECMNGSYQSVRQCINNTCQLHLYRMGNNPHRKKPIGEKRDPKTGRFLVTKKEMVIDGKYKLVRIDEP